MSSRKNRSALAGETAAAVDADSGIPVDPSERFLARHARWRSEVAQRQTATELDHEADQKAEGWFRGDTSSEAFSPSNYGLKR